MNLLITNDDGYDAPGIQALKKVLQKKHNVYLIAPDTNRSAVSHCISMFNSLSLTKIAEREYKCQGYPADCTGVGLLSDLFDVKFDAVISGINCGPNLGTDIVYSGTCAAARQAVLSGIPGIALSMDPVSKQFFPHELKYEVLAEFALNNLEKLISLCCCGQALEERKRFVNVNAPSIDKYTGVKFSKNLCVRTYADKIKIEEDKGLLKTKFIMTGQGQTLSDDASDYTYVRQGNVCISGICVEPVSDLLVDDLTFKL